MTAQRKPDENAGRPAGASLSAVACRPAKAADLARIVEIYNHYIENTPASFETEPHTVEGRQEWFASFGETGPFRLIVAELDGSVMGFACSARFNPRAAYSTSVETSVYLDPDYTGRGFGAPLYGALLDELDREPGLHRAYGGISLPNPASIALHERLGFRHVGTFREVGYKFDRYWDIARYERDLAGGVAVS